jgi:hypothetical protein
MVSKIALGVALVGLIIGTGATLVQGSPNMVNYVGMSMVFQSVGGLLFWGSVVGAMLTYKESPAR